MPFPRLACFAGRSVRSLEHALNMNAGTFPGEVAKRIDADVLAFEASKVTEASVVTTGTNGKTTTNNFIASCMERAGYDVFCNRAGSNLEAGIITALLDSRTAPFALLECDEMYTRFVTPKLKPKIFNLINLFEGDQIYRFGTMDRIYDAIAQALNDLPAASLIVVNGDDPNCQAVLERVTTPHPVISFGIKDAAPDDGADAFEGARCPVCGAELDEDDYHLRHYSQLGRWSCPSCKSAAPALDVVASNIREVPEGFLIDIAGSTEQLGGRDFAVSDVLVPCTGLYMVYNLLAVRIATALLGCPAKVFRDVVATFDPKNGRLQEYAVGGRAIMTNMAKNPVGFNQNIHMALKYPEPYAVAFLMDDMVECNGDYSWVDGIEFSMLHPAVEAGVPVFYGGEIADPLDRALSAAQITAERADTVADVLAKLADGGSRKLFVIANYHALERVCAELDRLQATTKQS